MTKLEYPRVEKRVAWDMVRTEGGYTLRCRAPKAAAAAKRAVGDFLVRHGVAPAPERDDGGLFIPAGAVAAVVGAFSCENVRIAKG